MTRTVKTSVVAQKLFVSPHGVKVLKIDGYAGALAVAAWVQVHDSVTEPATDAVPLKSMQVNPSAGFEYPWEEGVQCKNGCWVMFSADATKLVTTGITAVNTLSVDVEEFALAPNRAIVVGDLLTSVTTVTIAAGRRLKSITVKNLSAGADFYVLLAGAAVVLSSQSMGTTTVAQNEIYTFDFGTSGKVVSSNSLELTTDGGTNFAYQYEYFA